MSKPGKNIFLRQLTLLLAVGFPVQLVIAQTPDEPTSNPPSTPTEKAVFASTLERDNALLAIALPDEIRWLETPNEKIIALFKAAETRKTKGSLLILHAPELPQQWPPVLDSLRRNLPIYGWDTMTVPLPTKHFVNGREKDKGSVPDINGPNTESASSSSIAAAPEETTAAQASSTGAPSPRAQLIAERINAAVTLLDKIGQANIVVLVDNSSAPESLTELYKRTAQGKKAIQALVLVNLQNQEPLRQEQLAAIFSASELPVMDVFFAADDKYQIEVRRLHHAEAMRKNLKDYQQLVLPPEHLATIDDQQSFWLDKVRGFIKKQAEKKEVKKADKPQP